MRWVWFGKAKGDGPSCLEFWVVDDNLPACPWKKLQLSCKGIASAGSSSDDAPVRLRAIRNQLQETLTI